MAHGYYPGDSTFISELDDGVLCMQVFDSGLIGEGILHLLAWAHAKLLTPDAILVGL